MNGESWPLRPEAPCGAAHDTVIRTDGATARMILPGVLSCERCGGRPTDCRATRERARIVRYNAARIPAAFGGATLGGTYSKSEHRVWRWLEAGAACPLWLRGDSGVGKTYTLAAIARYLTLEARTPAHYVQIPAMASRMRRSFAAGDGAAHRLYDRAAAASVLLIDDVCASWTAHDAKLWSRLVMARCAAALVTVCASRHSLTGAAELAASRQGDAGVSESLQTALRGAGVLDVRLQRGRRR